MSHSVRITHTTTTSTSAVILNTGYLKTFPGLLKLAQLILGGIAVGIIAWNIGKFRSISYYATSELFFLLMAVAFLIGTFCLLLSCLISLSTGGIISKTAYELIYHSIAFVLYIIASIYLLVQLNNSNYRDNMHTWYMTAAILGLITSCLYLFSAILAQRSYRGI